MSQRKNVLEIQTCRGIHCLHFALSAFRFFFCAHMYKLVLKFRNTQKYFEVDVKGKHHALLPNTFYAVNGPVGLK